MPSGDATPAANHSSTSLFLQPRWLDWSRPPPGAGRHGARLHLLTDTERDRVLDLVRQAEFRHRRNAHYRAELSDWTAQAGQHREDGVPVDAFGPWTAMETVPLRDFTSGTPIARQVARFEAAPTLVLITTAADQPRDWVRAGIALELIWLDAVREGLSATPMTQPLELPDLRRDICTAWTTEHPQLLLRLGYGPTGRPTPRRDPQTVLRRRL